MTVYRQRGRYPKGMAVDFTAFIEIWEEALAKPEGIAVKSSNPRALMQRLYRARKDFSDGRFDGLAVTFVEDEVWIFPRR